MQHSSPFFDYEPVTRSRSRQSPDSEEAQATEWPVRTAGSIALDDERIAKEELPGSARNRQQPSPPALNREPHWLIKRGHALSYAGLFLFTCILYFRPHDFYPSVLTASIAFVLGGLTMVIFITTQLVLEGNLTARPREVNLVLLLVLAALLSIPLAINPVEAIEAFTRDFIKAIMMFIVMINVVRTEWRLKGMLFLVLAVSFVLSVGALYDYRIGNFVVDGYRVAGSIGGMFGNPNDMALHLVTIVPISIALLFSTRNLLLKLPYAVCAVLMVTAIVISFSRGAFLGLAISILVLAWKIGRRNRLAIAALVMAFGLAFLALAPASYLDRMATISNPSKEGSALSRRNVLLRSIEVAIANPLLGVGMGNFHIVSIKELVSHNAYTQVAADLGIPAMIVYVLFIITPFKQLRRIERETFASRRGSKYYYLSVGLQASMVGYMVSSFFGAVAYQYYIYYLVGYAICLRRIYSVDPNATKDVAASIKESARSFDANDRAREEVAATSRATSVSNLEWRDS